MTAFASADKSEMLGSGRFYGHAIFSDAENSGESRPHRRDIRTDLRLLESDGYVDIADGPAFAGNQPDNLGEQNLAVSSFPFV